ncbi:MAG: hypothetical protein KDK70_35425, partial [Myxococcales bacterium]|nr:hypothetical protein [Myxococcales bacterium]
MRRWATAAMLGTGLLSACDPGSTPPPDDGDDDEQALARDFRAATHGTSSLDGTPGFVHIGNLFAYTPGWGVDTTDADAVRQDAVASVYNRLALTFAVLGCEPDLQTDDDRQVSLTMQGCRLVLWEIDADVEATAHVQTAPCGAGECPVAVVWDLDVSQLHSGL